MSIKVTLLFQNEEHFEAKDGRISNDFGKNMSKLEADSLIKVSIFWLKKNGYLQGWKSGSIQWTNSWSDTKNWVSIRASTINEENYIEFIYAQTDQNGEKNDLDYKIPLTTTPCYLGGKRYWFICPWYANGKYCGRRVGVLYLGDKYFACRHCYDLTYNSRNLSGFSKVAGQVISIPELEKLESEVKRKHYAGKITRRYRRYMKKQVKSLYQLKVITSVLGN